MIKAAAQLFTPLRIRGMTSPNRIMLSPMNQHRARDGFADDWLLVHLGKFALGGFGIVTTEATAITLNGRIAPGDLGIWSDAHVPGLRRVTDLIRQMGAVSAIQINHSGRKGAIRRPWDGFGPLDDSDRDHGEAPWDLVSPTGEPVGPGHVVPKQLTEAGIADIVTAFGEATARADAAGFDMLEIHGGHGYLIASFLSPVVNTRNDAYGGDLAGRMRLPIDIVKAVRARWPEAKPLAFRISSVDGHPDGWQLADSVAFIRELKDCGVDLIDCSSGGLRTSTTLENAERRPGYQVVYSDEIRRLCGLPTVAVGLILDAHQAEAIVANGQADLVALGRQALYDPYWAHHAAQELGADPDFGRWPPSSGWWLTRRASDLRKIRFRPDGNPDLAASGFGSVQRH